MVLRVTPTYVFLEGRVPIDTWQAVLDELSYTQQEYGYVKGRGKIWQSHRISLVGQQAGTATTPGLAYFPAGLLPRVQHLLARASVIHFEEPAELPALVTRLHNGITLYEDQQVAAQAGLSKRRGLQALATNFGKTELMASWLLTLRPRRALVVVNQAGLARETAFRLEAALGERVTLCGAGSRPRQWERVTVATIQALYVKRAVPALLDQLSQIEVLLVDEVHTVSPPSWYPILERCTGAWFRLGFSGTVREARHQITLEAFFGPLIHEVTDVQLIQQGRSAATTVLMPRVGNLLEEIKDYDLLYHRGVSGAGARNQVLARFAATAAHLNLPTLVSFYLHEHGEVLERLCREDYLGPVYRLDGRTPLLQAEQVKAKAAAGEPGIYVLGISYNKGVNLPGARVLINAAAWRSPLTTSQRSGRVVRRKPDNWAVVVDPFDLGNTTLKNQAGERQRTYEKKGFQVEVDTTETLLSRLAALAAAGASGGGVMTGMTGG
jgi:superfamily II DNA or RNA helicase